MALDKQPSLSQLLNPSGSNYVANTAKSAAAAAAAAMASLPIEENNSQYVPTVGRWGLEWPSCLETTTNLGTKYDGTLLVGESAGTTSTKGSFNHNNNNCTNSTNYNNNNNNNNNNSNNNNNLDLYELIDQTQIEGEWPIGHPLAYPKWATPTKSYYFDSLIQYEKLVGLIELQIQKLLEEHNYDTVGNLLDFYDSYKRSGSSSLFEHYQSYSPPITKEHHTCVGLAFELWIRLNKELPKYYPNIIKYLHIVSCEENIESMPHYLSFFENTEVESYDVEKEHVLLSLKFQINDRHGVLLCDPGYHVSRVITVMYDKLYPHTGWFLQSEENQIKKEYNYEISRFNKKLIEWQEKTTRNNRIEEFIGLIYIEPYLTAVDVTERRNLVYNFRSLLARDQKGHLIAGIYFKIKENCDEFTIFYQDMGKQRLKMKFTSLLPPNITDKMLNIITICNEQLNLPEGRLLAMLRKIGELMNDQSFVRQLLKHNDCIDLMTMEDDDDDDEDDDDDDDDDDD